MGYGREDTSPELLALFTEVAGLLDGNWRVQAQEWSHGIDLVRDDGAKIDVSGWEGRYHITGIASGNPYDFTSEQRAEGLGWRHEITVTARKSAKAIAGDITRRVFPRFLASVKIAQEVAAARKATAEAVADANARLCEAGRGHASIGHQGDAYGRVVVAYDSGKSYGDFKPSTYQTIHYNVDLSNITPDQAARILAIVVEGR